MDNGLLKSSLKRLKLNESTISTVLGGLVIILVGVLVFNYFRNVGKTTQEASPSPATQEEQPESGETPKLEALPAQYTIQAGDSLWKIAEKTYGSGYNWVDIARENGMKNPNFLAAGITITLPKAEPKLATQPKVIASQATNSISGGSYTIVKGDNLWNIAVRAYGDGFKWVEIARENGLSHPGLIHPGNVLRIPR